MLDESGMLSNEAFKAAKQRLMEARLLAHYDTCYPTAEISVYRIGAIISYCYEDSSKHWPQLHGYSDAGVLFLAGYYHEIQFKSTQ